MTPYGRHRNKHDHHHRYSNDDQNIGGDLDGHTKPSSSGTAKAPPTVGKSKEHDASAASIMQSMFRSVSMMEPLSTSSIVDTVETNYQYKTSTEAFPVLPSKSPPYRKTKSSPAAVYSPSPASSSLWNVQSLPSLPLFYSLEPSVVTIERSLSMLTKQIVTFLKEHSIVSAYHNEDAKVDCMTSDQCHFTIQLWNGNNDNNETRDNTQTTTQVPSIIVEIQRRQGCCIEMQRLRQDLLQWLVHPEQADHNSKKNAIVRNAAPRKISVPVLQKLVEQSTRCDGTKAIPALTIDDCDNAYRIAYRLLKSERLDERRLGLESLQSLTNARGVVMDQAQYVAAKVLTDPDLQSTMLEFFKSVEATSKDEQNDDYDDEDAMDVDDRDSTIDYAQGRFFGSLHILALKVMKNSLDTAVYSSVDKHKEENGLYAITLSSPFWNHVLKAMIYDMHLSHVRPLEACLSVRCIRQLHTLIPEDLKERLNVFANYMQLDHFLMDAKTFGHQQYSQLEQETMQLMNQLGIAY